MHIFQGRADNPMSMDFSGSRVKGETVNGVGFGSCCFDDSYFEGVEFNNCNFFNCDFIGSQFAGAYFRNCAMHSTNFDESTFEDCEILGCSGFRTSFKDSVFRDGGMFYCNFDSLRFARAATKGGFRIWDCYLIEADFSDSKMSRVPVRTLFVGPIRLKRKGTSNTFRNMSEKDCTLDYRDKPRFWPRTEQ